MELSDDEKDEDQDPVLEEEAEGAEEEMEDDEEEDAGRSDSEGKGNREMRDKELEGKISRRHRTEREEFKGT